MRKLQLHFMGLYLPELIEASFSSSKSTNTLHTVRGKTAGAFVASGSFQWTFAVKALMVVVLRGMLAKNRLGSSILTGEKGSLAAALDHALVKAPLWLSDMFGSDESGRPLFRRFVFITNPGRKRPGPVSISLTPKFLEETHISIFLDNQELRSATDIAELLKKLEQRADDSDATLMAVA